MEHTGGKRVLSNTAHVSKPEAEIISMTKPPESTEWATLVAAQQSSKSRTSVLVVSKSD